ncbi:MAG: S-adenosylmethionine:2-demethylmenaquinone methyltransferase [Bacteroidota bacterium]|nr:S-adenosylmethionine:2-demethylmenaquinone methyltransferase [Bacteroidota bacterium]
MQVKTTDLCDVNADKVRVVEPGFSDFGGRADFYGIIHTVKCFEDNSFVRKALESDGDGKVLVVDGGGSTRCALLGDMLGELGVKNNWNGIIVYGCIRDSAAIATLDIGVKALDTVPLKSNKRNEGQENIPVRFGGVEFVPGEFIYCDEDGIIVSTENLIPLKVA